MSTYSGLDPDLRRLKTEILSSDRVARILTRIAYQIIERNKGGASIEVVGILRKGDRIAALLAERISETEGLDLKHRSLDVSKFRDDRDPSASGDNSSRDAVDFSGRDVILVDDVLFTGRTARAALDAVVQSGRPRSIQLVVLIDRGHREYPIQADYIGQKIPTKHREHVEVDVDGDLAVYLVE